MHVIEQLVVPETEMRTAAGTVDEKAVSLSLDGVRVMARAGEALIETILRHETIPHICYHSELMGPIQTCDTCMVEVDGELVRSCGVNAQAGISVVTQSERAIIELAA